MITASVVTAIPYVLSLAAVIGTFVGIFYTNWINVRLQNDRLRAEDRRQNRELLRAKGEELYLLIDDHEKTLRHTIVETVTAYEVGKGTQSVEIVCDRNRSNSMLLRIEMLTNVYFPIAESALRKLESYRQPLSNFISFLRQSNEAPRREYLVNELWNLVEEVQRNSDSLQQEIMHFLGTLHADLHG
jgi:hypothetical protein